MWMEVVDVEDGQLVGGECPWCYGIGSSHSPECRVMRQSSLQTQRSKTDQLRRETYLGATAEPPPPSNPFSPEDWNLTEQGRVYRADPELAQRMAIQAGVSIVSIGATKPRKLSDAERDAIARRAQAEGRTVQPSSFGGVYRTKEEPKDERTEVQKRFDALAEEFGSE